MRIPSEREHMTLVFFFTTTSLKSVLLSSLSSLTRRRQDAGKKNEYKVVKEILRLKPLDFSIREISRSINASVGGVHKLVRKAEEARLSPSGLSYTANSSVWG